MVLDPTTGCLYAAPAAPHSAYTAAVHPGYDVSQLLQQTTGQVVWVSLVLISTTKCLLIKIENVKIKKKCIKKKFNLINNYMVQFTNNN